MRAGDFSGLYAERLLDTMALLDFPAFGPFDGNLDFEIPP
jgi:hypothetical protein